MAASQEAGGSDTGEVSFRAVRGSLDPDVLAVRDAVYVGDQSRLSSTSDMTGTFDRYDAAATYLVAYGAGRPVGVVKVIADSPAGLPCEEHVSLGSLRSHHRVAEIGHLLTVPEVRQRGIGMALMRHGLVYAVQVAGATALLADFFADGDLRGGLRSFYELIGFTTVGEAFQDDRFTGSPLSRVGVLDIPAAARATPSTTGRQRELMEFFYGDYDQYSREAWPR